MGWTVKKLSVLPLVAMIGLIGCAVPGPHGSGKMVKVVRQVETFDQLAISGSGIAEIVVGGDSQSVEIETDDNLMELVETEVSGGKLSIKFRTPVSKTKGLNVKIQVAHFKQLELAGGYIVKIDDIDEPSLSLQTAGAVEVTGRGKVGQLSINAGGAGTFDCAELVAKDVNVQAAGSVSATVNATESLDVNIAGSGSVQYTGDPKINQKIVGSGSVKKLVVP